MNAIPRVAPEYPRIPKVAPKMAFSLRERFFKIGVVPGLLIEAFRNAAKFSKPSLATFLEFFGNPCNRECDWEALSRSTRAYLASAHRWDFSNALWKFNRATVVLQCLKPFQN